MASDPTRVWKPAPQDPEIERLVQAHRSQEQAWLSYADCTGADEEVRQAQAAVDRIRESRLGANVAQWLRG